MFYIMNYCNRKWYLDKDGSFFIAKGKEYRKMDEVPKAVREWAEYKLRKFGDAILNIDLMGDS